MDATRHILPSAPNTDKVSLREVRQFLQLRLLQFAPDAVLTHAWNEFYRTYSQLIRRIVARFRFPSEEADDLLQEVWTEVIVRLPEFDWQNEAARLRAWLYTVLRSRALNVIRRKARRRAISLDENLQGAEPADHSADPAALWEAKWDSELAHLLLAQIQKKVSPINYRLLYSRYVEGRSLSETAAQLGLSERQVSYRQHRLIRKLRMMRAALAVYRGESFSSATQA